MAFGVSSALAVGGLASPAGAEEPATEIRCSVATGTPEVSGHISGFPPDRSFSFFALLDFTHSQTLVVQSRSLRIGTDSTGAGSTPGSVLFDLDDLPVRIGFVVYDDANGNGLWDPDLDDTLYRGDGTVTGCPQSVTLTPK